MIVDILLEELWAFTSLNHFFALVQNTSFAGLFSLQALGIIITSLLPILFFIEIFTRVLKGSFEWRQIKVAVAIYFFNRVLFKGVSLAFAFVAAEQVRQSTPIDVSFTWYWFVYGYVVWEFSHFLYHWLGHKVRILWCLHSTHHAPEHMHLSVSYLHFFLEAPYADLVRLGICGLAGISPEMLLFIIVIDSFWGSFIHIGEEILPDGRLGFLNKIILTPSHHRLHHARNPDYVDTNFCNLLNIWDRLFNTYKEEVSNMPPEYGLRRKVDADSFVDVYFGEIANLYRDVKTMPGLTNKLALLIMPPGWQPKAALGSDPKEGA